MLHLHRVEGGAQARVCADHPDGIRPYETNPIPIGNIQDFLLGLTMDSVELPKPTGGDDRMTNPLPAAYLQGLGDKGSWDEDDGEWEILSTTYSTANQTLAVTTDHLSLWAVMINEQEADGDQDGKDRIEDTIADWAKDNWQILAGAAAVLLFLLGVAVLIGLRFRRQKEAKGWKDEGYHW